MFNEVLKSGVSNILPLNEIEQEFEKTSLLQVGTVAQSWSKSPCAPQRESPATQGRKICLGSFVTLRMGGCSWVFFPSQITGEEKRPTNTLLFSSTVGHGIPGSQCNLLLWLFILPVHSVRHCASLFQGGLKGGFDLLLGRRTGNSTSSPASPDVSA